MRPPPESRVELGCHKKLVMILPLHAASHLFIVPGWQGHGDGARGGWRLTHQPPGQAAGGGLSEEPGGGLPVTATSQQDTPHHRPAAGGMHGRGHSQYGVHHYILIGLWPCTEYNLPLNVQSLNYSVLDAPGMWLPDTAGHSWPCLTDWSILT